jgi:outer membrane receptor protein involved in Fe transport
MKWPFEFNDGGYAYYRGSNDIQNPRWTAKYVKFRESIQRTFGQMSLGYEILPGLNLLYRIGLDNYSNENTLQSPKGGVQFPTGVYRTVDERSTTWNHNLIGSYSHRFNSDFDISSSFGADFYINNYTQSGIYSENQLVFNVWNHSNFINHSNRGEGGGNLNYTTDVQQKGVFAEATGGYRNFLYVTAGGRNSWNSTLEKDNNHQFYPSASISIIPTSVIDALKGNKWINFAKIRFGYGTSARFPEAPYTTRSSLQINSAVFATRAGTIINTNTIPNLLPNKNLKPELLREVELGLEGRFIDNRVNLDITLYKRKSTDQILFRDLDPSTGYTTEQINGGDVENKGIEIAAGINIIRGKNVNWGIEGTFTINRNKVTSLPEGIEKINVAGYTDLGGFAVVGEPLGIIEGYYVQRYPAPNDPTKPGTGQLVVDGVGNYLSSTEIGIIGNPNPKFKTSVTNNVSYKGISFRMQWDYTHRGDIYSNTIRTLYARGLTKDTEMDRLRGYILPGVKEDGTPNDIINDATNIYFNSIGFGPYDRSIFDATVIRLREVSLSYALPSKLLSKTPFGGVSITLSGQNLWFNAPNTPKYMNFDPEVSGLGAGSYRGFDFLNGPSSRRYGGSIRVTF